MDDKLMKYFQLCNKQYKLQGAINYLTQNHKKDGFEYDSLDFALVEMRKLNLKINKMKKQYNY